MRGSARALPYALNVRAEPAPDAAAPLRLTFENQGAAGAHFTVTTPGATLGPWFYTVEAGKTLTDAPAAGAADLTVAGPNGFLRQFRGEADIGAELRYAAATDEVVLALSNRGEASCAVMVRSEGETRRYTLQPGGTAEDRWSVRARAGWYDIAVSVEQDSTFLRRFAGHLETGRPSPERTQAIGGGLARPVRAWPAVRRRLLWGLALARCGRSRSRKSPASSLSGPRPPSRGGPRAYR